MSTQPVISAAPPVLWTTVDLKQAVGEAQKRGDIVKGMIPSASVNIVVGESGIGKSPLFYDMCIRVAAGLPFLGYETTGGPTVMVDFENGADRVQLCETLAWHAGQQRVPKDFFHDPEPGVDFDAKVRHYKPVLVVIDSLKLFNPSALDGNGVVALHMLKKLQALARETGTAFLLIHHLRKTDRKVELPDLNVTPILDWLQEAAGTRSFINQTDVRMGVSADRKAKVESLVLKFFVKLRGEYGPVYVERIFEEGEPVGYRRLSGPALLRNTEYERLFAILPDQFRYCEAEKVTGKRSSSLVHFIRKCEAVGILSKDPLGYYRKVPC